MTLDEIPTPAALVDLDRVEANLGRMQSYAVEHGLALRPHAKTHKARWLGEAQIRHGAVGLTVATPVEAEHFAEVTTDLMIAYPTLGERARVAAEIATRARVVVALDSVDAVRALARASAHARTAPAVLVEADVGMRRCGAETPAQAVAVARACVEAGLEYRGLMFYPGHIRTRVEAQEPDLTRLRETLAGFIDALGDAGLAPATVSGGSTPTAYRSHELPALTEIRPGTYVFNDRTTAAIGACTFDEIAYTVLATVVSTAVAGQAVIDAGSKALSSDAIRAQGYDGFGELLGRPEVTVARMSEEHGVLDLSRSSWRPRVGERVRVVPNHVCVSVNLQTTIYGLRGDALERQWSPDARGWT